MLPQAEHAEEEGAEQDLEAEPDQREAEQRRVLLVQGAEAAGRPLAEDRPEDREPGDDHERSSDQAVLEPQLRPEPLDQRVGLVEVEHRVAASEDSELDDLRADQCRQAADDHGVDVEVDTAEVDRAGREREHHHQPECEQQQAGDHEEERRAVDEHEAQVAPAVAPGVQLRLAGARVVVDRHLADRDLALGGLEDHLGGELHAGRVQVEPGDGAAPDRAKAAVGVRDLDAEEDVQDRRQDRVADPAVLPGHRALVDPALEARAEHELLAGVELLEERPHLP